MVKWTGKEKTSTSFSGAKPTTGESMIIGAVDPIEITVNKATFITKLSDVQASMYTSAVREAAWVPQDTKYTPDQIRQALMNSPKIKTTFYYAQSPNCTNATVFMRVSINGRSITPDNVDVATSYSANQVDSRVTKVAAGATVKVLENDTPPENPEQSKSNPSSQTDSQVIDANQVNSANNTTTITPVDTVINSLVDETKTTVIKVGARPK